MDGRIGPDYEVIKELRRGPWVTVYEARHRVLGRRTLIKWLNPEHQGDDEMSGRLEREARLGAKVDHRNAARIYGVGTADGRPFVAIEWIEGEDLQALIEREGVLPFERVLQISRDLLAGLIAIHEKGVVHRDLSPSNVRLTKSGIARITDFGLAIGEYDPKFTLPGSVVGTPGYLSPEQAAGKDIDHRADLFSFAVLIHEALTGKALFRDKDLIATVKRVRNEPAPLLDDIVEGLPPGFSDWVNKFLEKKPDDRHESAKVALDELNEIVRIDEPEERDEVGEQKSFIHLPSTLLPVILGGLIIAILIQVFRPEPKGRITPPAMVLDSIPVTENVNKKTTMEPEEKTAENDTSREISDQNATGKNNDGEQISHLMRTQLTDKESAPVKEIPQKTNNKSTNDIEEPVETNVVKTPEPEYIQNGTGILVVQTKPWAEVFIDGVRIGTTPGLKALEHNTGHVTITFSNPGFPPISIDTTLYHNDTLQINCDLATYVGTLNLAAKPWAHVILDDIPLGDTPLGRPIYIAPGSHFLRLRHPEFGLAEKKFDISAGETLLLNINMITEGTPFANDQSRRQP